MQLNNIILLLAVIVFIAGVITTFTNIKKFARQRNFSDNPNALKRPKTHLILFAIAAVMMIAANGFQIIPTGYTGVRTTFGLIDQESCMPGLNITAPFIQKVNLVNNKQQDIRFDKQIWAETKEQTPVYMEGVTVTYQIVPESSAWIYANVENWVEELVDYDLVSSALKSAARRLGADNVTDRAEIEADSRTTLQESIDDKYGENRVVIKNIIINNMDFEESYNAAIAKKSEALQEQQTQAIQNQTKIDMAAAEAEAERERARGDADADKIRAAGKAEANKTIADSISPATQRQDAIDKWDGTLPKATGDDVSFGILDVAGNNITAATN